MKCNCNSSVPAISNDIGNSVEYYIYWWSSYYYLPGIWSSECNTYSKRYRWFRFHVFMDTGNTPELYYMPEPCVHANCCGYLCVHSNRYQQQWLQHYCNKDHVCDRCSRCIEQQQSDPLSRSSWQSVKSTDIVYRNERSTISPDEPRGRQVGFMRFKLRNIC